MVHIKDMDIEVGWGGFRKLSFFLTLCTENVFT
jgi:hypothetical protein